MITGLKLNENWDIHLDADQNLAIAKGEIRQNQDISTAIRLFKGEAILEVSRGIPYYETVLGEKPVYSLYASYMYDIASTVPGVDNFTISGINIQNRTIEATVQVTVGGENE